MFTFSLNSGKLGDWGGRWRGRGLENFQETSKNSIFKIQLHNVTCLTIHDGSATMSDYAKNKTKLLSYLMLLINFIRHEDNQYKYNKTSCFFFTFFLFLEWIYKFAFSCSQFTALSNCFQTVASTWSLEQQQILMLRVIQIMRWTASDSACSWLESALQAMACKH